MNINSLKSGYLGAGTNSIVAGRAYARVDIRLVPDQTPEKMHDIIMRHWPRTYSRALRAIKWFGGMPLRVSPDDPYVLKIADILRETWGMEPILNPSVGGYAPFRILVDALNAPFIQIPIGNPDQNEHSINENLKIDDMMRGIKTAAAILTGIGG